MQPGNHFHILIFAPKGLEGLDAFLDSCLLPLETWVSGFNGKTILRPAGGDPCWLEFNMDPSLTDEMHASGEIQLPSLVAYPLLDSLSQCLTRADFPHWIGLDCEETARTLVIHYRHPWAAREKSET